MSLSHLQTLRKLDDELRSSCNSLMIDVKLSAYLLDSEDFQKICEIADQIHREREMVEDIFRSGKERA